MYHNRSNSLVCLLVSSFDSASPRRRSTKTLSGGRTFPFSTISVQSTEEEYTAADDEDIVMIFSHLNQPSPYAFSNVWRLPLAVTQVGE